MGNYRIQCADSDDLARSIDAIENYPAALTRIATLEAQNALLVEVAIIANQVRPFLERHANIAYAELGFALDAARKGGAIK